MLLGHWILDIKKAEYPQPSLVKESIFVKMADLRTQNLVKPLLGDSSPMAQGSDTPNFFKDKTIFLTGGTGHLGGCILFKLTAVLHVRKIYVLCRGSAAMAKITIGKNMPLQAKDVCLYPGITFVEGDMTEPKFGISQDQLAHMEKEVQIIINSAADISLAAPLNKAIDNNCMPPLELAQMAKLFQRLEQFIQISTAFCNSFLPDGIVEEKIYPLGDAESELKIARETGATEYLSLFPAPYYYAKACGSKPLLGLHLANTVPFVQHLMERLLTVRYPNLPILLLRPTTIGQSSDRNTPVKSNNFWLV